MIHKSMQALILAGGFGTRLRSVVSDRPKSLAPCGEKPFLEHVLELLARQRVRRVVLCVGYLHQQIEQHFGDGSRWGLEIRYSIEERPLGTGGALKLAAPLVDGPFLTLNGDTYCDVDLQAMLHAHQTTAESPAAPLGTLALVSVPDARRYGTVELDEQGRIARFLEKQDVATGPALVSAGVYLLEPELLDLIPPGQSVSLERETFPALIGGSRGLAGYAADATFIDMGTPEGYRTLLHHLESPQPCSFAAKHR